jgi:photosystem II stability/assembly factor-like uncharacterized protein
MRHRSFSSLILLLVLPFLSLRSHAKSSDWLPYGPDGGDARAFAADPHDKQHLYLGTANGWIYESRDGGGSWKRLARVGNRDDLVLDNILIDSNAPSHILVGAWVLSKADGGMYVSNDGGATWSADGDMKGQSIRALVSSPSNSNIVVAGTLKGVYQSDDSGNHWRRITPEGNPELHEFESIAIDPKDPKIIYAGTWHLPWKTTDGGEHWSNMKQGIIDDSDVFSIIVDPKDPNVVYASACSGIYKSETAGSLFHKIQGIPSTARRTRVLMQDPLHQNIVFAGTTQGLYRTGDAGATWVRTTGPELIVNDVYINPTDSNRMLLATDRGGVLVSNDGGYSFKATNAGFSSRQITSYIEDSRTPGTIYVGLVNDKAWGGAFVSTNGGLTWTQKNAGLEAHDVFSLGQAPDGTIFAGTRHGIYRLTGDMWAKVDRVSLELPVAEPPPAPKPTTTRKGAAPRKTTATAKAPVKKKPPLKPFDGTVFSFTRDGDQIFAATSDGILVSKDSGQSWNLAANPDGHVWYVIASQKGTVFAASLSKASITNDGGKTWTNVAPPSDLTQITSVAVDGFGGLWIGGREGVYLSEDKGASWKTVQNFFMRDVNSIFYDAKGERVLVTANNSTTLVFAAHLPDKKVNYWNTGWNLRLVRPVGDHLVGATLFDGIVIQPAMVNSAEVTKH